MFNSRIRLIALAASICPLLPGLVQAHVASPDASSLKAITVSFKLDPRLSDPTRGGERWVSPPTYSGANAQDTVEARAQGIDAKGRPVRINPRWTPSDPEMVTVSPSEGDAVKIKVNRAGQSSLQVTAQGVSKELSIKAAYRGTFIQVEIAQAPSLPLQAQATTPTPKSQPPPSAASGVPDETTLYALGVSVAKGLASLDLTPSEADSVMKGIAYGLAGKAGGVDVEAARPKIKALAQARASMLLEKEKARGKTFREEAAKARDAVVWPSGLVYTEIKAGSGDSPGASDTVKVHYRGTLVDGTKFDSSDKRSGPSSFGVNRVIRCWTEGLQKMKVGGKARLVCPSDIAYGDRGAPPGIPPGATLVFEVELVEIVKATPSKAPPLSPGP